MDGVEAEKDIIVLVNHVNTSQFRRARYLCPRSQRRTFSSSIRTAMG